MTIEELADILAVDLQIRRYANQLNRYTASFERTGVKESKSDRILSSTHGNGKTPQEAISDYTKKICGKWLVVNAYSDNRIEFGVPETLAVGTSSPKERKE